MCGDRVLTGNAAWLALGVDHAPGTDGDVAPLTYSGGQLGRVIGAEGGTLPIDGFLDDDHPCAGLTQAMGGVVGRIEIVGHSGHQGQIRCGDGA